MNEGILNGTLVGQIYQIIDGAVYLPLVDENGVISWTNNAGLPNPDPRNIKGPKGDDGCSPEAKVEKSGDTTTITITDASGTTTAEVKDGATGQAAGFGNPTASIDDNTGTPEVIITASGEDTAKVFDFQFKNLKGGQGETGESGVYIGDDEPTDPDINVWIAPDDESMMIDVEFQLDDGTIKQYTFWGKER